MQLFKDLVAAKKRYMEDGENVVRSAIQDFFTQNPDIKTLWWTQYTPYFNDGEACVFGIGEVCGSSETKKLEDIDSYWESDELSDELYKVIYEFAKELGMVDDLLEFAFGDHCIVVATIDGFEIGEYEHD